MNPGNAEGLARWVASLQGTALEASAQLGQPLRSPGLRCACAAVQAVRLLRAAHEGIRAMRAGGEQVRRAAGGGDLAEALRLCQLLYRTGGTVGLAGSLFLVAGGRAAQEAWAAWSAAQPVPRRSPTVRLSRAVALGRAAVMALGGICHDRR